MSKFSLKALALAFVIAAIGILSSYYLSHQIEKQLYTQSYIRLKNQSQEIAHQIQTSINIAMHDLQALKALYSIKQEIPIDQFIHYIEILNIENRQYIQALSWIPLVMADERENFEAKIRQHYKNFQIREFNADGQLVVSSPKPYYLPVTLITPYKPNKTAHGFDLNSNLTRRASLEKARDSGKMTTTAKITLVQETGDSFGLLLIAPVYRLGENIANKEHSLKALEGYVTGVFRVQNLIENGLHLAKNEKLIVTLSDISAKADGDILFGEKNQNAEFSFNIQLPERIWQLQVSFEPDLVSSMKSPTVTYWILIGGSLASILLAICYYALQLLQKNRDQISQLTNQLQDQNIALEQTVLERTKDLDQKNQILNSNVKQLTEQKEILKGLMHETEAAKEAAEQRELELARSNRDLDDFAYIASHDLKAPLRGIAQLLSWIREDVDSGHLEEIQSNLDMASQRVKRLETLLNDLLTYSRANKKEEMLTIINSGELIKEMFTFVSPPPDFKLTLEGEFPVFTTIGPPFEQIIRNLLSNAIKHHDRKDGHIRVSCEEKDEFYRFSINDDGPGIPAEFHEQIFKMFKTLKPKSETEGSGMGLALIKKIVEHYAGSVEVESEEGKGCTFSFTWPKNL